MSRGQPLALDRGALVISIDTELAWSAMHHDHLAAGLLDPERAIAEREIVRRLLDLFDEYETRATWAMVGHLFLSACEPVDGSTHPEITRPGYSWLDRDWFARDPGTDLLRDPMWYGTDLLEMITESEVDHEIGSHSFSHLIVGDPECGEQAFRDDLEACRKVAVDSGVDLRSFVYPRNTIGHIEVLTDAGFSAYRGVRPAPFANMSPLARKVASVVDKLTPMAGSAVFPQREGSIWNIPATSLFAPLDRPGYMPIRGWVAQQRRRLRQASGLNSLYHLWFHPHNLLDDPDQSLEALAELLDESKELRSSGELENLSMSDLADRLNSLETSSGTEGRSGP